MATNDFQNAYYGFKEGYDRLSSTIMRVYDITDCDYDTGISENNKADPIYWLCIYISCLAT